MSNDDPPSSIPRALVQRFDAAAEAYEQHQRTPLGRLRTESIWQCLREHLPPEPIDVIDIGSGPGELSIRLAAQGALVVLVDPAPQMLQHARARTNRELPPDARGRVHVIEATLDEVAAEWRGRQFSVVLCHDTLEYIADEAAAWEALAGLITPGGILSVVVPNAYAATLGLALRGLLPRAIEAVAGARGEPDMMFGVRRRLYDLPTLVARMQKVGLEAKAIRGVRVFSDHTPSTVLESDLATSLRLDVEAGSREAYLGIARYLHVVACRRR